MLSGPPASPLVQYRTAIRKEESRDRIELVGGMELVVRAGGEGGEGAGGWLERRGEDRMDLLGELWARGLTHITEEVSSSRSLALFTELR